MRRVWLLFAVSFAGCSAHTREGAPLELPAVKVRLASAGAGPGAVWIPATVQAEERASLSTRVAARVQRVLVQEGSRVLKGAVLVRLDDSDVRGQLHAAQAALDTARAQERRLTALAQERAATPSELEAAQAQRAQAQAQVDGARAALGYSEIRAPFAGVVQAKLVSPGDLAVPGQPVIQLEGRGLELSATLSPAEAGQLRAGMPVSFEAGGARGTARITAISPGEDAISHRTLLRARVLEAPPGLRQGDFARLSLPGAVSDLLSLPRTALVERGDLTGVFVAREGHAELRWLLLGESTAESAFVRAGLQAGEPVIDSPGALRDGQPIEIINAR